MVWYYKRNIEHSIQLVSLFVLLSSTHSFNVINQTFRFLKRCGTNLTHLRLDSCGFVNDVTMNAINLFCKYLKGKVICLVEIACKSIRELMIDWFFSRIEFEKLYIHWISTLMSATEFPRNGVYRFLQDKYQYTLFGKLSSPHVQVEAHQLG